MARRIANRCIKLWKDKRGQDMLEYALYIATIGTLYAAFSPSVASSVTAILSKVATTVAAAATTGS